MDQNNELQLPIDLVETITDDKLRNNVTLDLSQRITAPVGDIKEIMDHANTILSSNYRFNNATSFKDISSRLTKEKLNVESKTVTVAATSSAVSTEIKPDDDYVGLGSVVVNVKPLQNLEVSRIIPENFNYIPDDSAELETIYLKPTNTTSTAIDITIATDNPTEYSGLNIVKINDIGITQNQKFTVSKEHIISSNTFKLVFADDKHFGASDVDITVPLVKNKRFTVNKNTIGRTYVPAEGDLALDGTSMTDTVPAIGFESVTLDASIASGVTASTLKSLSLSGQGGAKISPSGTALGYESVEIPTLEILEASKVKAAMLANITNIVPQDSSCLGYSEVQLPGTFDLQITASGVSSAKEMGANYLYIGRNTNSESELYTVSPMIVSNEADLYSTDTNVLLDAIDSSHITVLNGSSNNNLLRNVFVALPQSGSSSNNETTAVLLIGENFSSGAYINVTNTDSMFNFTNQLDNGTQEYEGYVVTEDSVVTVKYSINSGKYYGSVGGGVDSPMGSFYFTIYPESLNDDGSFWFDGANIKFSFKPLDINNTFNIDININYNSNSYTIQKSVSSFDATEAKLFYFYGD